MSARRWYWVGGTVMIVVVVIVYLVRRDSGQISAEQINMERYDEIKLGMNREDVEEILGGPPGSYYTTGETRHRKEIHFPPPELSGCKEEFWAGNDFEISVFSTNRAGSRERTLWGYTTRTHSVGSRHLHSPSEERRSALTTTKMRNSSEKSRPLSHRKCLMRRSNHL